MDNITTSIIIGYGAFGREVLRRLLVSSAGRGVLNWEETEGGQDPALRRLRDLGLVWVPDLPGLSDSSQSAEALDSGVFGILDDLYRQIEELTPGPRMGDALTVLLDEQARSLLRASSRSLRSGGAPPTLNVILVARPESPEVVGALNDLISGPMDRLSSYPNLQRPLEGGDLLNFVQILDFDHYWAEDSSARKLRRAVRLSAERWKKRSRQGKPGFGRIYLADSYTGEGVRDARHRLDEVVLFLELLLFESGQTGLEILYRRERDLLSPLAGFGVRAVEQNTELLSRLAAARFAHSWLRYLAEDQPGKPPSGLSELQELLAPYRDEGLQGLCGEENLSLQVESRFDELVQELTAIDIDLPDWSRQVRRRCRQGIARIQEEVFQQSGNRLLELRSSTLEPFPKKLQEAVSGALHHTTEPATLAQLIAALQEVSEAVQRAEPPPLPEPRADEPPWEELDALQRQYRSFKSTQVEPQLHRRRWPVLLSMFLTASLTPLAARAIAPWKDSGNYLLEALHGWFSPPAVMVPVLMVVTFLAAFFGVPPLLRRHTLRGRRFFTDPQRGRAAGLIRRLLVSGSPVRAQLDDALRSRVSDFAYSIREFVGSEIQRALDRLLERRREMLWLRGQLAEYSRTHAGEGSLGAEGERPAEMGPVVLQLESASELDRILDYNPPRRQRFQSTQSEVPLFEDWQQRFSTSFLYPLQFLDGPLSSIYRERSREDHENEGREAGAQRRARTAASIERQCRFATGFHWRVGGKAPEENRFALLPAQWSRLAEVDESLKGYAFRRRFETAQTDRAYLLKLQLAVGPEQLSQGEDP